MDENKIIRVVLEAKDDLTGAIRNATKNVKGELDGMNREFLKTRKGANLLEQEYEHMTQSIVDDSKKIDKGTKSVREMTKALREAGQEAKRLRAEANKSIVGVVQDIRGEASGRRTIRGPGGRVLPGGGQEAGDKIRINTLTRETVKINRSLNDVLASGYRIARDTQKQLDLELGATKGIRQQRLKDAEERNRQAKIRLSASQDERRAEEADIVEAETRASGLLEKRIAILKELTRAQNKLKESGSEDDAEEAQKIEDKYFFIGKQISQIQRNVSTERTRQFQQERQDLARAFNEEKANIKNLTREDAQRVIAEFQLRRKQLLASGTGRDRVGKTIGFAVGDFFGGISRGKSDVRDLDKDLEKLASTFGRLGFAVGSAFRDLNNLVNLRWLFITSAITLLINVMTQLVVVLVSVASSAILAGAALGGALVAGLTQAVPVVGLLAAAFHSLQNVMKAVQLEDKAQIGSDADAKEAADKRTQAVQKLADAHYAVKQAIQSVKDANYNLEQSHKDVTLAEQNHTQAVKDVAEARKQAARDIVDANQQEKDSALALEEAELGVLQAKEKLRKENEKARSRDADLEGARLAVKEAQDRLNLARAQGDNAEIVKANQQLSVANQNLNDIQDNAADATNDLKDAQLGVKRAEIDRQQAASKKKRDAQDAAKLRKQGIEQNQRVIDAQKQLAAATRGIADAQHDVAQAQIQVANSIHQLAISRREEVDAKNALADKTNLQSTAQKNLNEAIAQFSPAEKKLYQSLLRVKNAYKKAFSGTPGKDGILAPILGGFTAISDAIVKLLTDPKILKSLGGLSKAIGDGIGRFAKLLTSKGFKSDLIFFIDQATENLPKVFDILLDIFGLITKIGREAAPIFSDLLDGIDGLLGKANKAAGQKVGGVNSGGRPEEGTRGPTGAKQQTRLGRFFEGAEKHLKAWLSLGKAIGRVVYLLVNVSAPTGKSLIESATDALNKLGDYIEKNPEAVQKFFTEVSDSFKDLANALLDLVKIFGKAASDPNIQNFALFLVEVIVPGIYAMITAVGYLFGVLDKLTKVPILGSFVKFALTIAVAEKALNKLFPVTQGVTNLIRKGLTKAFEGLFYLFKNPKNALAAAKVQIQLIGLAAENSGKKLVAMGANWKKVGTDAATAIGRFVKLAKAQGLITTITALLPGLATAFEVMWAAATGPVGLVILAIAAVVLALVLLDRKFHFIRPTIEFFGKVIRSTYEWIKSHWHLVVALITGPIGVAVLLIIKHWEKIKRLFFGFKDLLTKYYFKPVYNALIKPFVEAGAFILGIFKALPKLIGKALSPLGKIVSNIIRKIPGFDKAVSIIKFGQKHNLIPTKGPIDAITGLAGDVAGGIGGAADAADTALGGSHPKKRTASNVLNNDVRDQKTIRRLRKSGLTDDDILDWLINHGAISRGGFRKRFGFPLTSVEGFSGGSAGVKGAGNKDTVPAMLTPGEWVLNSNQIKKVAQLMGTNIQQARAMIFGTNMGRTGNPGTWGTAGHGRGLKPSKAHSPFLGGSFTLIPQDDADGNTVWFIQLANGTFGQVTKRDADKIQSTNGRYIPGYVKRNSNGFAHKIRTEMNPLGFANGGIVPAGVRGFASGGVVQSPGHGNTTDSKTIQQNFNVRTEGATDWNYVMRLGAISAQGSF